MREEAYQRLSELIAAGTLAPGERLRDDELAEWLGVSRTPVREALARLVDAGLVEMAANRFTRVTPLSADTAADGYPIRARLEGLAAASAAGSIDGTQLEHLREAAERFTWATWRDDTDEALAAEAVLHETLTTASPNGRLRALLDRLRPSLARLERHVWPEVGPVWPAEHHARLIEALARRSAAEASAAAEAEWRAVGALVGSALERRGL